ncbi:efflux RND transporter periplasmic adaptor subunit [Stieleria varia]|uniref:Macrolide export protein MacA n=1 Tax=Stieleria varia TaxID=2528005 RepID=A0A5C6B3R5_9BACT|nr:efflux RND transporter periplasmic adaptor subunit [Stieleria varia]TWU06111.1 Macrolide export protein MacA [Stieleria varia]
MLHDRLSLSSQRWQFCRCQIAHRQTAHRQIAHRRRGSLLGALLTVLVIAGLVGYAGYRYMLEKQSGIDTSTLITQAVVVAPFDHIVLEQGEVESSSNIELVCEIKSRGTSSGIPILWVIDEGTRVNEGDKLVELDAAALETALKEDKISVIAAEANVTTARAAVEQAKIARQEYLEGVFKTEERAILSEMAVAQQDLRKAQLALGSSQRLVAKGLVKSLQLDADKFAVANARNQLAAAEGRLKVLQDLTRKKMLVQFDSDIEAAEAQLAAYESELEEEQLQLADTTAQLEKCVIKAPAAGVVVHANRYSSRGGNAEFVVEAGATVRERQAIIQLPDPSLMQVNCKINESRITLIEAGMPVKIAVDAIPGLQLRGRVTKVNRYAEPGSFFSSSIKEYATLIEILDPPDVIRTGMTAEVQIFVEQIADAVQIPIQGLYEHGDKMYSLVQRGPQEFETVEVELGATNDTMASIKSGLKPDEVVVLNLREHLDLMDLPELSAIDNSEMKDIGRGNPGAAESAERGRPDGAPGERGERGGRGGPDGGRQGGGPGAGGPGGGGRPDPATMVERSMSNNDKDGDGVLSPEEISAMDPQYRDRVAEADADGDGSITRAELTEHMQKRFGGT